MAEQDEHTRGNAQIKDLFIQIGKALEIVWGNNWGTYIAAYPSAEDSSIKTPIITYRLKQRQCATLNSVTEIKPRIRKEEILPDGNVIRIYGQKFDNLLEFGVWADNELEVADIADRFEEFMLTYAGIFRQSGIDDILYTETTDEPPPTAWRTDLNQRYVRYHVKTERIIPISMNVLNELKLKVFTGTKTEDLNNTLRS